MASDYSIGAVSKITGLPIDTLRAWERRYALVVPVRDGSGIRRYTVDDVARLQLAAAATVRGHPIRHVAPLRDDEIRALLAAHVTSNAGDAPGQLVERILAAVRRYDIAQAEDLLNTGAMLSPPDAFAIDVLSPLMHAVGSQWQKDELSLAQEHLITTLVRNLVGSFSRLRPPASGPPMVFATPPHEAHEFGISLAACLAALRGVRTYVLGPCVPVDELVKAARALHGQTIVVGAILRDRGAALRDYVIALRDGLPSGTRVWVGGAGADSLEAPEVDGIDCIATLPEFCRRLQRA